MPDNPEKNQVPADQSETANNTAGSQKKPEKPVEHNGPAGLEPTRYGDWERNGRCTDF